MGSEAFESILVVYQNHKPGRQTPYDDWYTNIHIRDAMRLDGAIATQRFAVSADQPVINGKAQKPAHWAHTIYEWESAAKSVSGHTDRAGTSLMEISSDGEFNGLRDYFFRPVYLSHGWTKQKGFRDGVDVMTALIATPSCGAEAFVKWFKSEHAPDTLRLPGIANAALFDLHEEQSLPTPSQHRFVAIYSLSDRKAALKAWSERNAAASPLDLSAKVENYEIGCWEPRIPRLLADDVAQPTALAAGEERRAREAYKDLFLTQEQLGELLTDTSAKS
ncbi:MAG: hypothetical protein ABWZ40_09700 [Caulobacterales bacterium]